MILAMREILIFSIVGDYSQTWGLAIEVCDQS